MNGKVGGDMAAALLHDDKIPSVSKERLIRTKSLRRNLKWRLNTYMSSLKKEVRKGRDIPRARGVPGQVTNSNITQPERTQIIRFIQGLNVHK